jgi:hypothetical protein
MTHPIPDPNPPALVIGRMHRTTAAVKDHPETYDSRTLSALMHASMEMTKVAYDELSRRAAL